MAEDKVDVEEIIAILGDIVKTLIDYGIETGEHFGDTD